MTVSGEDSVVSKRFVWLRSMDYIPPIPPGIPGGGGGGGGGGIPGGAGGGGATGGGGGKPGGGGGKPGGGGGAGGNDGSGTAAIQRGVSLVLLLVNCSKELSVNRSAKNKLLLDTPSNRDNTVLPL